MTIVGTVQGGMAIRKEPNMLIVQNRTQMEAMHGVAGIQSNKVSEQTIGQVSRTINMGLRTNTDK